ncbi:flagellar protein FlaG [Paenibacillus sp. CC-CFT747]|nr:flagellar protein FlaG [Paenibacillus sp. CC-CFT747]
MNPNIPRTDAAMPVSLEKEFTGRPSSQENVISNIDAIRNTKEIKEAEIKGENVHISDEQLIKTIERALKAAEGRITTLEFSVHQKTHQIMVKVHDKETGDIIREVPAEKTLDFVSKIWELAGLMVDERR